MYNMHLKIITPSSVMSIPFDRPVQVMFYMKHCTSPAGLPLVSASLLSIDGLYSVISCLVLNIYIDNYLILSTFSRLLRTRLISDLQCNCT